MNYTCILSLFVVQVVRLGIDRQRCSAMVQFDSIEAAKDALTGVKGTFIGNSRRIMVCTMVIIYIYTRASIGLACLDLLYQFIALTSLHCLTYKCVFTHILS